MASKSLVREWLWRASHRGINIGDLWGGIVGNLLTAWVHLHPSQPTAVTNLIWQIPVFGLAGGMAWRFVVTPFDMIREARSRADLAEARLNDLTSGGPVRDLVSVVDGALYMRFHDWGYSLGDLSAEQQITIPLQGFGVMEHDAVHGQLIIYTKRERHGRKHLNPGAEYWENHHIDWTRDELAARPTAGGSLTVTWDPMVRKCDIERLYGPH